MADGTPDRAPSRPPPRGWGDRARFTGWDGGLYALLWLGFLAVMAMAVAVRPDRSGFGTHTQLHLPPCGFYLVFGKPCPSCGMTTSFSVTVTTVPELSSAVVLV